MVISTRFLYRNRLRTVTFWLKESRRQMNGTFSSSTRCPAGGAFGRMMLAGISLSTVRQTLQVTRVTSSSAAATQTAATPQWNGALTGGRSYMMQ